MRKEFMEMLVWFFFLSWAAWKDLRLRRVPVWLLAVLGLFGGIVWKGGAAAIVPGVFLLAVSILSGGGLGLGDALFFLVSAGFFTAGELWVLLFGGLMISGFWGLGWFTKQLWKTESVKKKTIPFLACAWPAGVGLVWEHWKKEGLSLELPAVMTVEASYVMAIVLLSLACLIGVAYDRCREYTAVMTLHYHVERLRGQEEEKKSDLMFGGWKGQVKREEKQVIGLAEGEGWSKEIMVDIHMPEEFMRKAAAAEEGLGLSGGGDEGEKRGLLPEADGAE